MSANFSVSDSQVEQNFDLLVTIAEHSKEIDTIAEVPAQIDTVTGPGIMIEEAVVGVRPLDVEHKSQTKSAVLPDPHIPRLHKLNSLRDLEALSPIT